MVLFLMACVHPPANGVQAALESPDPWSSLPWRATVVQVGPFELEPGKRVFSPAGADFHPFVVAVVAIEGPVVRVVDTTANVRVAVGVRVEDLAVAPVDRVHISEGVELAGGADVTLSAPEGGRVRVDAREDGIRASGWADATAFGPVWRHRPFAPAGDRSLTLPIALRDAPDGDPVAELTDAWGWYAVEEVGFEGDWRKVRVTSSTITATGWVPAAAVGAADGVLGGVLGGVRPPSGPSVSLPAGTPLSPRPGAAPFARTTAKVALRLVSHDGHVARVRFASGWGDLDGYVDCAVARCE